MHLFNRLLFFLLGKFIVHFKKRSKKKGQHTSAKSTSKLIMIKQVLDLIEILVVFFKYRVIATFYSIRRVIFNGKAIRLPHSRAGKM